MRRVRIIVPRGRAYGSGDGFEVFGDGGSGAIDFSRPLAAQPVRLWPDAAPRAGHLREAHLLAAHLDGVAPVGHLRSRHLVGEHLWPGGEVAFVAGPYIFGRIRHAVRMRDALGNADEAGTFVVESVLNSWPRRPGALRAVEYDGATGRVTFSFSPSADLQE